MISFYEASQRLEYMCDAVDSTEITDELIKDFAECKEDFSSAVDQRISYIKYCESQIDLATKMQNEWHDRASKFKNIIARIKQNTIDTINANPNLPYKGKLGSVRIQKNSVPALRYDEDDFLHNERYRKISYSVDTQMLTRDLKQGIPVPGASLEWGEHLRISVK